MKKFTFDLQRFDDPVTPTPVGTIDALKAAIKDKTGAVEVTLTANISGNIDLSSYSALTSLTIDTNGHTISGNFTGVKSLNLGNGQTVSTDHASGVNVEVAENKIDAITNAAGLTAAETVTYSTTTYTSGGPNLMLEGGTVYGIDSSTNIRDLDTNAKFYIDGVTSAAGITYNGTTVNVAQDAGALATQDITIQNITGTATLAYSSPAATDANYSWEINGNIASYKRAPYYKYNSESNTIEYVTDEVELELEFDSPLTVPTEDPEINPDVYLKRYLTVDRGTSKVTVKAYDDNDTDANPAVILNNGFTINTDGYSINTLTVGGFSVVAGSQAFESGTEAGSVLVKGQWSEGYYLSDNDTRLNYVEATDAASKVTLATITGLNSTFSAANFAVNDTTSTQIDLKAAALTNQNVTITTAEKPDGTDNINEYTLGFKSDGGVTTTGDTTASGTKPTKTPVWQTLTSQNSATYRLVTPEYYTIDSGSTSITYHQEDEADDGTTLGVINGLTAQPDTDDSKASFKLNADRTAIDVVYKDSNGDSQTTTGVISAESDTNGVYTFTIKTDALPTTNASVTLTKQARGAKLAIDGGTKQTLKASGTAPAWTFDPVDESDNTETGVAVLTADLTTGYTLSDNDTVINIAEGGSDKTILKISGLKAGLDVNKLTDYVDIEGYDPEDATTTKAGADTSTDGITITLKKAALSTGEVSITTNNPSFNYKLALADDAQMLGENESATDHPTKIPHKQNVWVFENGNAIFKEVVPEHYELVNGKVTYIGAVTNKTYATISGLADIFTGIKFDTDTYTVTSADGSTEYITVDTTTNKITLNSTALAGKDVTMQRDAGTNYTLELQSGQTGTRETLNVATPATYKKWWTVESGGKATLHQSLIAGHTLATNGLSVKYNAEVGDRVLAEVTGLSDAVKALDNEGTEASEGVQLGVVSEGGTAIIAHSTYSAYDSENEAYTWNDSAAQTITLSASMLNKKKVTVTDKYKSDTETFQLALSNTTDTKTDDDSDIPATSAVATTEWEADGGATATFVSYKKGYYKTSGTAAINYVADTTHKPMLIIAGLTPLDEGESYTLDDDGKTLKKGEDAYITLDTSAKTITLNDAVVPDDTAVTLTSKNTSYNGYKFALTTPPTTTETFDYDSTNNVKYTKTVEEDDLILSANGKSVTKSTGEETLMFTISGLSKEVLDSIEDTDDTDDAENWKGITYNESTKTVTLPYAVLKGSGSKITLTSSDGAKYKFALGSDVPKTAKPGFSWNVTEGSTSTVVGKEVTLEYFTKGDTTITHNAESAGTTLFTLSGLVSSVTAAAGQADKDGNYIFSDEAGNTIFSVNKTAKTVTLADAALNDPTNDPPEDGYTISISGTGWKLAAIQEPTYNTDVTDGSNWTISDEADGTKTATLSFKVTKGGYKLSKDGQTLTYIAKDGDGDSTKTGTAVDFLKITGLNANYTDEELKAYLASAYNAGTKKVTLPKEVLGTSNVTLNSLNEDDYQLALATDVLTTDVLTTANQSGYSWSIDSGNGNVTFKSVNRAYFTAPSTTASTSITAKYNAESNATTQFVIYGLKTTGITQSDGTGDDNMSVAIAKDKDGNTRLTSTNLTDYISVNTATYKVTLNSAILPANGDEVRIGGGTGEYTLYDNFKTPTYTSPTWSNLENGASTLSFTVDTGAAGYKLSTNGKTLSYIGSGTHDFLTVTGLKAAPDATVYDAINKTVTLPNTVLNNAQVKLTSENGDSYTLNLGTELDPVRTSALNNSNVWVYNGGTLTSKSVTRDYYKRDNTNSNVFNYKPQANEVEQFTITGLNITSAPDDTDGDTSYGEYLSFNASTEKIKILNASILPKSNAPIAITGNYSFDTDTVDQPIYSSANATWGNPSEGTATLSITASKEGYEVSNGDKTLTYVNTETAKEIATISGIPSSISTGTDLGKGITVDADAKTITFSASVLGDKNIVLSDSSEYTLALGDDVTTTQGDDPQNVWEISGTNAYYRSIFPKYYTSEDNGAYIAYHAKEQSGSDLVAFSGLKDSGITVNADGDIVENGKTTPLVTVDGMTILVNTEALADSGIEITANSDEYRFALNSEAVMKSTAWTYDSNKGEVTVTGTFGAGYIVSDDGQKILKKADNGTEVLAKITGLKKGLTLNDDATKALFDFDEFNRTITFKDDTLLKGTTIVEIGDADGNATTSNFFSYNLALNTTNINTTSTTATPKWVVNTENVTNEGGDVIGTKVTGISYKNVTPARYTLLSNNVITVTPESATGSALATVTGLKELAAGQSWAEGTTANAFSIVNDNGTAYAAGVDAVSVDSNKVITVKTIALPDTVEEGQTPAEVKFTVNNGYTLALDPTDQTISSTPTYSNYNWVQDATVAVEAAEAGASDGSEAAEDGEGAGGDSESAEEETPETEPNHTAYIKADKTASYAINANSDTIIFTPGEDQATIATIEGLSAVNEDKSQNINTSSTSELGNGAYVDVLEKTIYLTNAAMNGENITLTNSGVDFSLALYDEQNKVASDKWSYDESTKAYKYASTTPAYYTRTDATNITYNKETPSETPYFKISGLKDGLTIADNAVKSGENQVISIDQSTKTVTLKKDALPAYVPASTATETDDATGEETVVTTPAVEVNVAITDTNGYKLAFGTDVNNKSVAGAKSYEINEATGAVTVSEKVTAGYALNAAGTAITYNDGTGSTPLFTITGLNIDATPTEQAGWDALFTVDGTTVTVNSAALGNSDVTINNDDYTLALGSDVTKESGATSSYDWVLDNEATKTYSYKLTKGFYYAIESNEIKYQDKTPSGTALVTVKGLQDTDTTAATVDTINKTITLTQNALETPEADNDSVISITSGDYKFVLDAGVGAGTEHEPSYAWNVASGTAAYVKTETKDPAYTLTQNDKTVAYVAGHDEHEDVIKITGLNTELTEAGDNITFDSGDNKVVVLSANALGNSKVSLTVGDDYTLKLGDDVNEVTYSDVWSFNSTTGVATLTNEASGDGYTLDDTSKNIDYASQASLSKNHITLSGLNKELTVTSGAIAGISVENGAEEGDPRTIKLNGNVFAGSDVKIAAASGSPTKIIDKYNIAFGDDVTAIKTSESATNKDWVYSEPSSKPTFTFKGTEGYYTVTSTGTNKDKVIDYTAPKTYVTISGTNFATSITGDDTAKVNEFKKFVNTTADKVTIKKSSDDNTTTLVKDTSTTLTVTTAGDYTVELNPGDGVSATGTSWAYDGNKLILESDLSAGYTLKETKANNYTLGTSGKQAAQKLATISGLDLASAKEEAEKLTLEDTEKTAALTAADLTDESEEVQKNAAYAAAKFNKYIKANITVADTGTITIKQPLLGTSAVTIANSGDVDYKLNITSDIPNKFYVGSATAVDNASDLWTFSGGTATLKETTPEYYTLDTKTNKITYTAAKATATLATVKGLFSSKVLGSGELEDLATISQTIDGTKKTTVKTNTFYTDTTVVKVNDNNVIGAQTIRKTQVVTTTQTDTIDAETKAVTKAGKPTTTKGAVEEVALPAGVTYDGEAIATFKPGIAVVNVDTDNDGVTDTTKIKVNEKVLGTSTVTLTNGKDSSGAVQTYKLDYIAAGDDDALTTATETLTAANIPKVTRETPTWTGSVNGTSTVLKADYSAGYELAGDGMKITYTAAKNNVSLATIGGIIIKFDDTAKAELEPTDAELQTKLNDKIATAEATALEEKKAEYVAEKLTENLAGAEDGAVVSLTEDQKTELAALTLTDDEKEKIAAATALTTAEKNAIKTEKTAAAVNTWVATHINYTSTDLDDKGATADAPIQFTIQDDAVFNKKDITVTSNDKKNYAIELKDTLVTAQGNIATTPSYTWNGTTYQKSDHDVYYTQATTVSGGATTTIPTKIKYNAAAGVVKLATVTGLKSGTDISATWTAGTGTNAAGGTLNVDASMLGTSKVTLTPTAAATSLGADFTFTLATTGENSVPTLAADYDGIYDGGEWLISGGNATLKGGGKKAYYTLDETTSTTKTISYHAESGTKTLATLKGLKADATAEAFSDSTAEGVRTITLKEAALGTTNITLAKGSGDTLTYKLKLDDDIDPSHIITDSDSETDAPNWATTGVNTTLKGAVTEGWELSANELTAVHTASATNKALATLVFDKAGITAGSATVVGKTVTLDNIRTIGEGESKKNNSKITIKTNTDGLTFNITDANFKGAATNEKVSAIGSALADGFTFANGRDNIIVSGAAGDDTINLGAQATNASISGGAGDDAINFGTGSQSITLNGDAGNDIITGGIKADSEAAIINKIYGGAGDDSIKLVQLAGTSSVWGDAGNDTIEVEAGAGFINGGAGDDSIKVADAVTSLSILGDVGNDEISIGGAVTTSTVNGGAGNDVITIGEHDEGKTKNVTSSRIVLDAGDDQLDISGDVDSATMLAGAGNDAITIGGAVTGATTINADAGNDEITIGGAVTGATILAGIGNDKITIGKDDAAENKKNLTGGRIVLDAGNDELYITGDIDNTEETKSTILAGAGDDKITVGGDASYATILADAGNDTVSIGGAANHITINAAAGNDEIHIGSAEAISIFGGDGIDEINIGAVTDSTINAGAANDIINISGNLSGSSIFGDAGNDSMTFASVGASTINAGAGNDTITITNAEDVSVLGDAGDDVITFTAGSGTVFGGAGNDTVDLGSGAVDFYYISGNGNDYIQNFTEGTNKFVLKAGTIKSAAVGGINDADLILTIGSNKVTLEGAGIRTSNEFSYTSGVGEAAAKTVSIAGIAASADLAEDINGLIYEDNNLMTPNDISDIVSTNSVTEYHVGNYNLTTPDQILPQSDNISYSDQQKKNK